MRKLCIACVLALGALSASTVLAEEKTGTNTEEKAKFPLSITLESDLYSAYVWRGCILNDRPVWQPSVASSLDLFGYGALNANLWMNYDLWGQKRVGHQTFAGLSEIDYTLSYSVDIKDVSLEVGHIWYTFPKANGSDYAGSTKEVYGKAAYNNKIVTPSIGFYGDYDAVKGWYIPVGLNHEFALTDQLTLGLDAIVGLGDKKELNAYHGGDRTLEGGLCDFTADAYLSYAVTDNLSLGAKLAWTSILGGDARGNAKDQDPMDETDILWGGISATLTF